MEFYDSNNNINNINSSNNSNSVDNEMWEGLEEDYCLSNYSQLDVLQTLWECIDQIDNDLRISKGNQTPTRHSGDFRLDALGTGYNNDKELEESEESSPQKRRRMMQFTSNDNDTSMRNKQIIPLNINSKFKDPLAVTEDASLTGVGFSENFQWNRQQISSFLEPSNTRLELETEVVQETSNCTTLRIFKGRKSYIKSSTKLTSSIAHPFTLIKPSGVQGDVTLKDINQRIHAPLSSWSKRKKDEAPSLSYPTSTFSGKPVAVRTKIRNKGGKGSITISRTRG